MLPFVQNVIMGNEKGRTWISNGETKKGLLSNKPKTAQQIKQIQNENKHILQIHAKSGYSTSTLIFIQWLGSD